MSSLLANHLEPLMKDLFLETRSVSEGGRRKDFLAHAAGYFLSRLRIGTSTTGGNNLTI